MLSSALLTCSILSLIASTGASPIETTRSVNRTGLCGRQGDKMLGLNPELPGPACAFTATVSFQWELHVSSIPAPFFSSCSLTELSLASCFFRSPYANILACASKASYGHPAFVYQLPIREISSVSRNYPIASLLNTNHQHLPFTHSLIPGIDCCELNTCICSVRNAASARSRISTVSRCMSV